MSLFEAMQVYRVETDEDGYWVNFSDSDIQIDTDEVILDEDDALRPLHVSGVKPMDFVVTVDMLPETADADLVTHSYFVSHVDGHVGIIVPGDLLEVNPKTWMTDRLLHFISGMTESEFAQFTLPKLAAYVKNRVVD